jgi:hypothetical protein
MKTYATLLGMFLALFLIISAHAQEYATFTITSPNQGTGTFTNAALPDFTWETIGSLSQNVQILDDETFEDGSQFETDYGQADNEQNLRTQVIPNGTGTAGTTIVSGSITTIVFNEPTPANSWGICLTDIDVENVVFHALDANSDTVPVDVIDNWLVELFDADISDGVDLPKWDPEYAALLGSDTPDGYTFDTLVIGGMPSCEAPAAYLRPSIPITTLAITFMNLQEEYHTSYHLYIASQEASSIAEAVEESLHLYPNPCDDKLVLKYSRIENRKSKIEIVDISGSIAKTIPLNAATHQQDEIHIDIGDLAPGIYFVRLSTATKNLVKKVVVY